jgi:hypothetical protein
MTQPKQPATLETMTTARDYWYGRAIHLEAELEKARAQLAAHPDEWVPVPDGYYCGDIEVTENGSSIGVFVDEDYGYTSAELTENFRLCRRVQREDE